MSSKITRLSPTDVANISPLPTRAKRSALETIETPKVFWNYRPVYSAFPKILMVGSGLFGKLPKDSDEQILNEIRKACFRDDQEAANIAVALAVIKWRNETGAKGVLVSPEPYRTTVDTIQFCADVAVILDEELHVINLDVRSQMNLRSQGKDFMKSLIRHTALIGDLRNAKVAILRTPASSPGVRKCVLEELTGEPAFSMDAVERMILETYSIWQTILMARRSGADRAADEGEGPLFDR